jgi:hypothetical protein
MSNQPNRPRRPITVMRKVTPMGDRCWYFADGKPISMAPELAVQGAERGEIRIRTQGDDKRGPQWSRS